MYVLLRLAPSLSAATNNYPLGRTRNAELKRNAKTDTGKQHGVVDKMTLEQQHIMNYFKL